MSAAEFLKRMSRAPPIAVLQLWYGTEKFNVLESMLQHADDLDFTQDVLNASADALEVNPTLKGVLEGFNRRRRDKRFKFGHHTVELDGLRFAHTVGEKDSDLQATEIIHTRGSSRSGRRRRGSEERFIRICSYFQRQSVCSQRTCRYAHRCSVCNKLGHGAINCYQRRFGGNVEKKIRWTGRQAESKGERDIQPQENDRPPHSRSRRSRANEGEIETMANY